MNLLAFNLNNSSILQLTFENFHFVRVYFRFTIPIRKPLLGYHYDIVTGKNVLASNVNIARNIKPGIAYIIMFSSEKNDL